MMSPVTIEPPNFRWIAERQAMLALELFVYGVAMFFFSIRGSSLFISHDEGSVSVGLRPGPLLIAVIFFIIYGGFRLINMQRKRKIPPQASTLSHVARALEDRAQVNRAGAEPRPPELSVRLVSLTVTPHACVSHACTRHTPKGPAKRRRARTLEVSPEGLQVDTRPIAWDAVRKIDWVHDGIELQLADSTLFLTTLRLPRAFGPVDHFPELRHALAGAAVSAMSYNRDLARVLEFVRERCGVTVSG